MIETIKKSLIPFVISLYIGGTAGFIIRDKMQPKQDITLSTLQNYSSTTQICLDDIAMAYLATGAIMSEPTNVQKFKQMLKDNEEYKMLPYRDFTQNVTPEYFKKRGHQLLGLVERLSK